LKTGQLVKDEYLSLFDAVGALEVCLQERKVADFLEADLVQIMDSKMDSGHLEPGESLEDEYDILRPLSPEEVIGIMDQILCHEVSDLHYDDVAKSSKFKLGAGCLA
jgi:N-alpha-acetyltransferase 35, NatC auxiliary subunit